MKLMYAAGACSMGIHVVLEEIGKPYEAEAFNLREGQQYQPPFTDYNPKSKVPTLVRDDGSVLTEYGAIATWLARTNPDAHLMPADPDGEARALEAMDFAVGTIHMQGYARLFRPSNFGPNAADEAAVKARGMELIEKAYAVVDHRLEGHDYLAGAYSVADSALFYTSFWGAKRMSVALPKNVAAHFERMMARPAVQRTLAAEGLV